MTTVAEKYYELLTLTQKHILDEYPGKQWIPTDEAHLTFYRSTLSKQPVQRKEPPTTKQREPIPARVQRPATVQAPPKQTQAAPAPEPTKQHSAKPVTPVPQPEPKKEVPSVAQPQKQLFKLEPVTSPDPLDLTEIRKTLESLSLGVPFLNTPDDDEVKKLHQRSKQTQESPSVIILSFDEEPAERTFLNNVAKAIDVCIEPATVYSAKKVNQHQAWGQIFSNKNLKLVIATDYGMYGMPSLMEHYRESPDKKTRYLGGVPVLLLSNIKFYMKQPNLKQALWKAICTCMKHI